MVGILWEIMQPSGFWEEEGIQKFGCRISVIIGEVFFKIL